MNLPVLYVSTEEDVRETAKKSSSLNGRAIKEKNNFFEPFFMNPLSSRGGGGLGLNGPAIERRTLILAASLISYKAKGSRKKSSSLKGRAIKA